MSRHFFGPFHKDCTVLCFLMEVQTAVRVLGVQIVIVRVKLDMRTVCCGVMRVTWTPVLAAALGLFFMMIAMTKVIALLLTLTTAPWHSFSTATQSLPPGAAWKTSSWCDAKA